MACRRTENKSKHWRRPGLADRRSLASEVAGPMDQWPPRLGRPDDKLAVRRGGEIRPPVGQSEFVGWLPFLPGDESPRERTARSKPGCSRDCRAAQIRGWYAHLTQRQAALQTRAACQA